MKKLTTLLAIMTIFALGSNAAVQAAPQKQAAKQPVQKVQKCDKDYAQKKADWENLTPEQREQKKAEFKAKHEQMMQDFDTKLGLTDAQKAKAKEIRLKGHDEIKPTMEKLQAKHKELRAVKESTTLSEQEKEKKTAALKAEIKPLKEQANTIRKKNMAEFEAILTPEQKTKFEEMKQERKNNHKGKNKPGTKKPCAKKAK